MNLATMPDATNPVQRLLAATRKGRKKEEKPITNDRAHVGHEAAERAKERARNMHSHTIGIIARKKEEKPSTKGKRTRGRNPSFKKDIMNTSMSSISELEAVITFNDEASFSNMSNLSYMTGSYDSLQLSFLGTPTLAQGPSLFVTEKTASRMAPKMPRRDTSEARLECGNDSDGSLSLDEMMDEIIMEEASSHSCASPTSPPTIARPCSRPWSEGANCKAVNMPMRSNSLHSDASESSASLSDSSTSASSFASFDSTEVDYDVSQQMKARCAV